MNPIKILIGLTSVVAIAGLLLLVETNVNLRPKAKIKNPGVLSVNAPETVSLSAPFDVLLVIDTKGRAVNAVSTYLDFDSRLLEIINLDTSSSFCQFYPENKFDNDHGTIRISCGTPQPGFTGISTIAKVTLSAKTIGNAQLHLMPGSQILLNDGRGTNILEEYPLHEILIINDI